MKIQAYKDGKSVRWVLVERERSTQQRLHFFYITFGVRASQLQMIYCLKRCGFKAFHGAKQVC